MNLSPEKKPYTHHRIFRKTFMMCISIIAIFTFIVVLHILVNDDQEEQKDNDEQSLSAEVFDILPTVPIEIETPEIEIEKPISSTDQVNIFTEEIGAIYNVDPALIQSVIWHESRYNPDTTTGGCLGLMQVCTRWHMERASRLGVTDFYDPYSNILVGVDILSSLMSQGDTGLALMLYNMAHDEAYKLHASGRLSWYAESVMERADRIRSGEL